ncbi:MAG: DUF4159 domain-containing protein [Planctomycetaceae bacterium]|nr:DUF4159 domain-containing protein [Planctomycetaceae bacterium]
MFRFAAASAVLICFVLVKPATTQELEPDKVRRAIEQGIQYLKSREKNGSWGAYLEERMGPTSLAVLALISCGVPKDDPVIDRAMNFLRQNSGNKAGKNYSISLQTMAFCLVDPERDLAFIRENVELFKGMQIRENNEHSGGWDYLPVSGSNRSDLSNSQFSILALYEAERVGVSVPRDVWHRAAAYWTRTQNKNGSWGYTPAPRGGSGNGNGHGSMTCAGIASMVITSGITGAGGAKINGNKILCSLPAQHSETYRIEAGIDWLDKHFSVSQNPQFGGSHLYYYLYALERVGRMTNRRFIGQHDWYREGAAQLLRTRDEFTGCWRSHGAENDIVATSFALLFLSKGRRPVLMSKVQFGKTNDWNVHPNDANNITNYAEKNWKIDLTWQNIEIKRATVDHLIQTPVLYFCGNNSPLPDNKNEADELVQKLRGYLELGGFILAESQPDGAAFDKGFRELTKLMFPEPDYELRLLESSHPIWAAETPIEPEFLRPLEGISFGCRTSVVYAPPFKDNFAGNKPSLSCLWEVADIFNRRENISPAVQRQIDAGLKTGLNILAYATNRELKYKDEIAESVEKKAADSGTHRGSVFIGVLEHSGGAGSAPRAASNLLRWLNLNYGTPVASKTESVSLNGDNLFAYPFLMMHGRNSFEWTEAQCGALKKHLENGGFLFADAVCSSKEFDVSFKAVMRTMFPNQPLERIPSDDALFSEQHGGTVIRTLPLRIPERSPERKTMVSEREVEPELYGIQKDGRWLVVYSPNDVSCALESASSLECRGYTPKGAMQLAVNVLFYALGHW